MHFLTKDAAVTSPSVVESGGQLVPLDEEQERDLPGYS